MKANDLDFIRICSMFRGMVVQASRMLLENVVQRHPHRHDSANSVFEVFAKIMPTYDYVCEACDHEFEVFQSITEEAKRKCPNAASRSCAA